MPLESHSFFISYSRADYAFVLRLVQDLKAAGAAVWLDQLDIELSETWDVAIEKALTGTPHLIAILSPNSVASNNVMDEVSFALEEKKIVIPILFQPCEIPFRLRRLQRMDFTGEYDQALQTLISRLRLLPAHTGEIPPDQTPTVFQPPSPQPPEPDPIPTPQPQIQQDPAPPRPAPPVSHPAPAPPTVAKSVIEVHTPSVPAPAAHQSHLDIFGKKPTPVLAAFLALIPGLGAVYNRQFRKAALFLLAYIVLFLLTHASAIFILIFLGFMGYMIYDAYTTAKNLRNGTTKP